MNWRDKGKSSFPSGQLKPGDRILICEHLVKRYWCNVVRSARVPDAPVFVGQGGTFKREDGSQGNVTLSVKCERGEVDLWEAIWDGERLKIADFERAA